MSFMSNPNTNVTPITSAPQNLRRARGAFVRSLMENDDRSARYMAGKIGISPTSMGERLSGKSPFQADELEHIAVALKMEPGDFYLQYISVGPEGYDPPTSSVESRELAPVTSIFRAAI